jgi:hypothetical protein
MVFLSQGVRRWKGVSEEGGRERSCFNELSLGWEGKHMQRLENDEVWKGIHEEHGERAKSFQNEEI